MSPTLDTAYETSVALGLMGYSATKPGSYYQAAMGRGPLGYWRMSSVNVAFDEVAGHHGQFYAIRPDLVKGILLGDPDLCFRMADRPAPNPGSKQAGCIVLPHETWMDVPEFSFTGLVRLEDTFPGTTAVVARAGVSFTGWGLLLDPGQFRFVVGNSVTTVIVPAGLGDYHFAITAGSGRAILYLDGEEIGILPWDPASNQDPATDLTFGALLPGFSSEAFPGLLDEFTYYDFMLSPDQIEEDYLNYSRGQEFTLTGAVEMDTPRWTLPRFANAVQTYRQVVLADDPWAYWTHRQYQRLNVTVDSHTLVFDYGNHGHDADTAHINAPGHRDVLLGPIASGETLFAGNEQEAENPILLGNGYDHSDGPGIESRDAIATSEFTASVWLSISTREADPALTQPLPLLCLAPSQGASTFDKCLFLGTDGKLKWLTGIGGSAEVISDTDVFPRDAVARHVVVSVGPAGSKLRVNKVTKATGSNTSSWTGAQKVFYYTGGANGTYDFNVDTSLPRRLFMQATIFDHQLSDARTDEHHRVGRSYQNIADFWGMSDPLLASLYVSETKELTGDRLATTGQPSIIPADPNTQAMLVANEMYVGLAPATVPPNEIRHTYWRPATVAGTQLVTGLYQFDEQFSQFPQGYINVGPRWELFVIDGFLTWIGNVTNNNGRIPLDTFTHTVGIAATGHTHSLGMRISGATVDLWVNGIKQTFTRSESAGWFTFSSGTNIGEYTLGSHPAYATLTSQVPFSDPWIHQLSGVVDEFLYNNATNYQIPENFFEDLAIAGSTRAPVPLFTADSTEMAFDLTPYQVPNDQVLTIGTAFETEAAFPISQRIRLETAIEMDQAFTLIYPPPEHIVTFQGAADLTVADFEVITMTAELRLTILNPEIVRAPSSITVTAAGGEATTPVVFAIDGVEVFSTTLDSDGCLGPTSINVSASVGSQGVHTMTVTQTTAAGVTSDEQTFTVLEQPNPYPVTAGPDNDPVDVPAAVGRWVFQDLVPGGLGSYVLPINPRNMTSPHLEFAITTKPTTSVTEGQVQLFQAGNIPKEWQFSGYCPTQEQQEAMLRYRYLNRRFYVIDHHHRAWTCVFTNAEFVPRLRQTFNGVETDWGSDYTITAIVLDQRPITPLEV